MTKRKQKNAGSDDPTITDAKTAQKTKKLDAPEIEDVIETAEQVLEEVEPEEEEPVSRCGCW